MSAITAKERKDSVLSLFYGEKTEKSNTMRSTLSIRSSDKSPRKPGSGQAANSCYPGQQILLYGKQNKITANKTTRTYT